MDMDGRSRAELIALREEIKVEAKSAKGAARRELQALQTEVNTRLHEMEIAVHGEVLSELRIARRRSRNLWKHTQFLAGENEELRVRVEELEFLNERLEGEVRDFQTRLDQHEARLESLEEWRREENELRCERLLGVG